MRILGNLRALCRTTPISYRADQFLLYFSHSGQPHGNFEGKILWVGMAVMKVGKRWILCGKQMGKQQGKCGNCGGLYKTTPNDCKVAIDLTSNLHILASFITSVLPSLVHSTPLPYSISISPCLPWLSLAFPHSPSLHWYQSKFQGLLWEYTL